MKKDTTPALDFAAAASDGTVAGFCDRASAVQTLGRGLPSELTANVTYSDASSIYLDAFSYSSNYRPLLEVDDLRFLKRTGTIWMDEIRVHAGWVDGTLYERGAGIGTIFTDNLTQLALIGGYKQICLRAGRENGPLFWSLHGFGFEDENAAKRCDFVNVVKQNLATIQDTGALPQGAAEAVNAILDAPFDPLMNCRIATIPYTLDGKPLGHALFENIREFMAVARLDCPASKPYFDRTSERAAHYASAIKNARANKAAAAPSPSAQAPASLHV